LPGKSVVVVVDVEVVVVVVVVVDSVVDVVVEDVVDVVGTVVVVVVGLSAWSTLEAIPSRPFSIASRKHIPVYAEQAVAMSRTNAAAFNLIEEDR